MSDYLLAFWDDFEKQIDNSRSAQFFKQNRKRKYVIREANVALTLKDATYANHQAIMDTLNILALHIQDYVGGLRHDVIEEDEESEQSEEEGTEEINVDDLETELIGDPTGSLIQEIKNPLIRSPISTFILTNSSNIPSTSSSLNLDHDY